MSNYELNDGIYTIEVSLDGGTGRASITTPTELTVKDGATYAQIEWSSSNYDYMLLDGEKILPVNETGNSVFELPVRVYDEPIKVIADTTAMSVPHEIEYELTFSYSSIKGENINDSNNTLYIGGAGIAVAIIAALLTGRIYINRKKSYKEKI